MLKVRPAWFLDSFALHMEQSCKIGQVLIVHPGQTHLTHQLLGSAGRSPFTGAPENQIFSSRGVCMLSC